MFRRFALLAFSLAAVAFLAACDTAEERAQKHYEKAMALLDEGDVDRAMVEFRNVFKLNGYHREARLALADVEEKRGNVSGAYGNYLRLVEQYPEDLAGRRALARLAAALNNWEEVERHVAVAKELAPEDPVVQSVQAGLDYRNAMRDDDADTAALAVKVSETLLADDPALATSRQVVIDNLLRRQDWTGALAEIDAGLAQFPDNAALYRLRLGVLERLGRDDEIVAQLRDMVQRFPDAGLHRVLVGRFIAQGRLDEAEAYFRERIDAAPDDADARLELLAFLQANVGAEAARAEVERILSTDPDRRAVFRSVRAALDFEAGDRDGAIAELEDILKDAEPSDDIDRIKISLARMLIQMGNPVGARVRVEEVLAHNPNNVAALKMKAGWLIDDDKTGDALVDLRSALDQAPQDAGIMTLMALAHERAGNRDLMGEMLALAVEASGNAPAEALRYVGFLMQEEKYLSAEDVLQDALRLRNEDPALLAALGNVYVRMEDWARAQGVIDRLQRIGTEPSLAVANELTARKLAGQKRSDELEGFLSGLADSAGGGLQAAASIIRLRLAQGDTAGALQYVDGLLAEDPENPALRFIRASVLSLNGQQDEAIVIFRDLLAAHPENEQVWLALYRLHRSRGEAEQATTLLKDAQAAVPQSAYLKLIAAGEAERSGDIDGAIAIYEELYARNSNSQVVANNLASLISSYRDDPETLQRAYDIARRLRGTEVPAFQDTYGWIAFRLGNHDEALEYLEPAAKGLPGDPTVQYHLAETYAATERPTEALEQYRKVVKIVETSERPPLPFMDRVTAEITRLSAAEN